MMKLRTLLAFALCATYLFGIHDAAAMGEGDPVKLSITAAAEYTDNRDSSPAEEENTDLFLTPRIDAILHGERLMLDFYYMPSYRYRSDPSDIQNDTELHHDLGINLTHNVSPKVKLRANERFNITDDPAIVEEGTTLRRDSSYAMNRAELGMTVGVTRRGHIDVSGHHRIKMYDEGIVADESDEERLQAKGRLWNQLGPTLGIMVMGEYMVQDYDSARGLERGFDAIYAGVGVEKILGKALRGQVSVGWSELEYEDSALGSDSAPYVQALIKLSPHDRAELAVTVSYMLRDSDVYPYTSQEYTSLGADLKWAASKQWVLNGGLTYRLGEYDVDSAPVTTTDATYVRPVGGDEETVVGHVGVTFVINSKTSLGLRQLYEDVDSDVSTTFTRNATRLGLSKVF